ncbi:hypothetical protein [Hyphomicrobium sp. D-2]|uniref:hypothetical protein n=1 Tax=Hyphomicrobium sp. D-2 TaxID=3041621 RepID=UPI002458E00F|nr:hypothetical protein [Hyphomicrobium sp. D-2]MDH4980942.1 hypothetical protein [Hyphomicrobium sp. D-2]
MDERDALQPVTITRDELYRRVWETPMSRLAEEFGITGKGLSKICDRLEIPYPPRGYWARKAAGQKVVKFRLLKRSESAPDNVTITPSPPPLKLKPEQQEVVDTAKADAEGLTVPDELRRPHAVIAQWREERKERQRRARLDRSPYRSAVPDWSESERRQHRILNTIFRAVDKHGFTPRSEHAGRFFFEYRTEKIDCRLREKNRQVRRPKTTEEKRWSYHGDRDWMQELEPTGNLVFAIEEYFRPDEGIRKEWLETQTRRLEGCVPEIVANILLAGPALVKKREEREAEQRQYREAERLRQIEQARQRKNRNQWRALVEQAEHFETAVKVRNLIAALETTAADPSLMIGERSLPEWIAWAKQYLDSFDPLSRGAEEIFGDISKVTDWTYRD